VQLNSAPGEKTNKTDLAVKMLWVSVNTASAPSAKILHWRHLLLTATTVIAAQKWIHGGYM